MQHRVSRTLLYLTASLCQHELHCALQEAKKKNPSEACLANTSQDLYEMYLVDFEIPQVYCHCLEQQRLNANSQNCIEILVDSDWWSHINHHLSSTHSSVASEAFVANALVRTSSPAVPLQHVGG